MKKVLVIALAALFIMASCSTAFAATTTTTTTYGSDGITVTTTVTGAANETMVSFLAYNGEKAPANAVFADQQTSDGNTLTFAYTDAAADVKTSEVILGASAGTVEPANDDLGDNVKTITVAGQTVYVPDSYASFTVNYTVPSDKAFVAAKVGDVNLEATYAAGTLTIPANAAIVDNCEITIVLEDVVTIEIKDEIAGKYAKADKEYLTVFARVIAPEDAEYGIVVADSEANLASGEEYKALGKNVTDGAFAVQLVNEAEAELVDASTWARVYVKVGSEYTYGDAIEVTVKAE